MMTKLTIAFLSGAVTVAACVVAAGGRASIITFALGVFLSAVVLVAALASRTRLRSAARFLSAFAQALESKRPTELRAVEDEPAPDSVAGQIVAGLMQLGVRDGEPKRKHKLARRDERAARERDTRAERGGRGGRCGRARGRGRACARGRGRACARR